MTITFSFV